MVGLSEHPGGDSGSTAGGAGPAIWRKAISPADLMQADLVTNDRMSKSPTTLKERDTSASTDDIRRILGDLDDAKVLDILALRPTILDIEEASMWLSGDADVFGAGEPLKRIADDIVAILTANEEEEPPLSK